MSLKDEDVERVAEVLHSKLQVSYKKDFWIQPEIHYNQHKSLEELVEDWRTVRGMFLKAFVGCAIIGMLVFAAVGAFFKFAKG